MPCLATRSKVDSSIPIIKTNSVEARTRHFSITGIARYPLGQAGTVKPHTSTLYYGKYINIMIVQQTCAILDDFQRLHYR